MTDYSGSVVVGGGIAGLATAAALYHMAGVSHIVILEQSETMMDTDGAAVQLGPNGFRALQAIGGKECLERVLNAGTCLQGNQVVLPNGTTMKIPDTNQQVLIRWGVLRTILKDLLAQQRDDGIIGPTVQTNVTGTMQDFQHAPLIVAADGIRSAFADMVRNSDSYNINDNGRLNIKAVVPADINIPDYQQGYACTFFTPDASVACFAGPAGNGYTYWAISIADEHVDEDNVVRFLHDIDLNDLVLVQELLLVRLKSLNVSECQFAIDLVEMTKPERLYVRRSEETRDIGSSLYSSNIVLVGDSAQAMNASYGQCANFALEDAATLGYHVQTAPSLESAMQRYSDDRLTRKKVMAQKSVERAQKHRDGKATDDVSTWIMKWRVPSQEGDDDGILDSSS